MGVEKVVEKLFKGADEEEPRAHDHLRQRQKSNHYYNQDEDDDGDMGINSRVNVILSLQAFTNLELYKFFISRFHFNNFIYITFIQSLHCTHPIYDDIN